MGKKEKFQKEIDILIEKMRFWRYVLLAVISGIIGILYGISQGKTEANWAILIFVISGFIIMSIAIKRLDSIHKKAINYLDLLEKEQ